VSRLAAAFAVAATTACSHTPSPSIQEPVMSTTTTKSGLAPVNGLQLYYEIHGAGDPLIVLHGALGSTEMFGPNLAALAAHRQVIGVDLQAHGRTADIDRPMTFEAMADDVAALIDHLGLGKADVMGYSLGGAVALQTAIRHPDRVRRLVVVSAVIKRGAWLPEVRAGLDALSPAFADMMKPSPVYQRYAAISPRPDFAGLLGQVATLVKVDYDWTAQAAALPPTLIVVGDADGFAMSEVAAFYAALGGGTRDPGWDGSAGRSPSQLAILPGVNHYDMPTQPALAAAVERFLSFPE
jgi:pimeloyl-ACP methyl ester carboxylesterase